MGTHTIDCLNTVSVQSNTDWTPVRSPEATGFPPELQEVFDQMLTPPRQTALGQIDVDSTPSRYWNLKEELFGFALAVFSVCITGLSNTDMHFPA